MNRFLKRTKISIILMGAALLLLGLILFVNPINAMLFITIALGWVLAVVGGVMIAGAIISPLPALSQGDFMMGIVALVFGCCIIVWPGVFVSALYLILGIVILVTGIGDVSSALDERRLGLSDWKAALAIGIVTLLMGVLVIAAPFAFADAVMMLAGIALVFDGVTEIVVGIRLPSDSGN